MRYQDPILQDKLAAEYVMGNLTGRARRRFENLLLQYPELQAYVTAWAERLQPLNEDIVPITPPESVWENLLAHSEASKPALWSNLVFWRGFGMAAASLILVVSVYFLVIGRPTQHVVFVMNQNAQPEWIVAAKTRSQRVLVQTITPPTLPQNKVCVLWLVWKDGKSQSIGALPDKVGKTEIMLPKNITHNPETANVVVSVETKGGQWEKPAGEIVFNGPWVEL